MVQPGGPRSDWHVRLRRILETYFDESELEGLCFDLRYDYEQLPGESKSERVVELIKSFSRMGRVEELIDYCSQLRPNVPWSELRADAVLHPLAVEQPQELVPPPPPSGPPYPSPAGAPGDSFRHPQAHVAVPGGKRRRHVGVWAAGTIVVLLAAVFIWCALSDVSCPWEKTPSPPVRSRILPPPGPTAEPATTVIEPSEPAPEPPASGPTLVTVFPIPIPELSVLGDPFIPTQLAPPDGSVFDTYPRTTTLQWSEVASAASYTVEIDCMGCCAPGQWCRDVGQVWVVVPGITATSYTFDFVGAQPGRWRVWSVDAEGNEHPVSPWWRFEYTR